MLALNVNRLNRVEQCENLGARLHRAESVVDDDLASLAGEYKMPFVVLNDFDCKVWCDDALRFGEEGAEEVSDELREF